MNIHSIGIDLGKTTFPPRRAWRPRHHPIEEEVVPEATPGVNGQSASITDRAGSLLRIAFSSASAAWTGARCAADSSSVRQTVSEVEQE